MNKSVMRPLGKLLRPKDVAEMLSVPLTLLKQWVEEGSGPKYIKFNPMQQAVIRYEEQAVKDFIEETRKQSMVSIESAAVRVSEEKTEKIKSLAYELVQKNRRCEEQSTIIKRLEEAARNQLALVKEQKATIQRLMNSIMEHKKLVKDPPKQAPTPPDTEKADALNKELERTREENKTYRGKVKRLGESITSLTARIEKMKSARKPSEKAATQRQVYFEVVRGHFLREAREWIVTRESGQQLLDRIKTLEMPDA